ncbi:MAG: hypothetical protein AB4290_14805 [Spirulina sp.]
MRTNTEFAPEKSGICAIASGERAIGNPLPIPYDSIGFEVLKLTKYCCPVICHSLIRHRPLILKAP